MWQPREARLGCVVPRCVVPGVCCTQVCYKQVCCKQVLCIWGEVPASRVRWGLQSLSAQGLGRIEGPLRPSVSSSVQWGLCSE